MVASRSGARTKPLSVKPLRASQPVGGVLATLGFERAMPLLHGSQGCTAFGKVYFVRHFNEPIPLQTTAVDRTAAIMGADDNLTEALRTLCSKSAPSLITVITTGLTEAAGTDIERLVRTFRRDHPELAAATTIVPVAAPEFNGSLESGYAATLRAILDVVLPAPAFARTRPGRAPRRVNLLLSSALAPGDVEALCELVEAFGLEPVAIPDLGASLDGHLDDTRFSPLSIAGTRLEALDECGDAAATIVVGASLFASADLLAERTGVPDFRFTHLMGLAESDRLVMALRELSGRAVPRRVQRQRRQLQDALLDTHLTLGMRRLAIAAEADLLAGVAALGEGIGMEVVAAVAPDERAAGLAHLADSLPLQIGDLQDLERQAEAGGAELLIGSGHAVASAETLGIPIIQRGYPIWERFGLHTRSWIGYRGSRDALYDWANALAAEHEQHGGLAPYRSIFKIERSPDAGGAHRCGKSYSTPRQPA
ncbi:nitrogenase iron-molybdenum cofactor biosynthesis protein NifN [Halorhodospira abdelmalekii]|nr:nitrogenase iron-molybdenum cofactor biosynthesis protein NifN [Halorhodospira abdelmalekii]